MKKSILKSAILAVFICLVGIQTKAQVTAAFNLMGTTTCQDIPTVFNDVSTGGVTTWEWSFPGGSPSTSTSQYPSITFSTAGSYNIQLIVTDGASYSDTLIQAVTIYSSPSITIASYTNISCFGLVDGTATVTASGGLSPYTYNWSNSITTTTNNNLASGSYSVTTTDNYGCKTSTSVIITEPSSINISLGSTNSNCGMSDGTTNCTPGGGTAPFTFLWNNGSTLQDLSALPAGMYTVTVTDANGCTNSSSIAVNDNGGPTAAIATTTNISCNGLADGSATVSATGGTAPYSYYWMNGATNATNSNLTAGSYGVTVTDNSGCIASTSVVITQPSAISASLSTTNNTCFASGDGFINLTATGGAGSYTYYWSNGSVTQNINNLFAGSYTVSITDANGCMVNYSANITQPSGIAVGVSSLTDVTCFGGNNGSVTLSATGGMGVFTYLWNTGDSVEVSNSLLAGAYEVTATDANGCVGTTTFTVNQPTIISMTITVTDVTCSGLADGALSIDLIGGAGGFSYSLNSVGGNPSLSNLSAGPYFVEVTDANGCIVSDSANVLEPSPLIVSINSVDETSSGACDGQATANVSGGSGSYSYTWSNGMAAVSTLDSLCVGTYTVSINDTNGCFASANVSVSTSAGCAVSVSINTSNVSCFGAADGGANATPTGGTGPYTYLWDNGSSIGALANISAGTYFVTVTDNAGCTSSASANILEPSLLSASINAVDETSAGACDGQMTAAVTGGSGSYNYTWSNGMAAVSIIDSLCVGTYGVTVADNSGCVASATGTINTASSCTLAASASSTPASCDGSADGTSTVIATGGTTPYLYIWDDMHTDQSPTGRVNGTYTVTVTDNQGCTAIAYTTVTFNNTLSATTSSTLSSCVGNDGIVQVIATGGTGDYSYEWIDVDSIVIGNTDSIASLAVGSYTVNVIDNISGCSTSAVEVVSQVPNDVVVTGVVTNSTCGNPDGSINATVTGGTPPYSYAWSNSGSLEDMDFLLAGEYYLGATDQNGCFAQTDFVVSDVNGPTVTLDSIVNANCGAMDGHIYITATGGVAPLIYTWNNGATTEDLKASAGNYTLVVTDANGCIGGLAAEIMQDGVNAPSVSGVVTRDLNGNFINSGLVEVIQVSTGITRASSALSAGGLYSIPTLHPVGDYVLKASPDVSIYPNAIPTYYGLTTLWNSAIVTNMQCDNNYVIDFEVIDLTPLSGTSTILGLITADTTGGQFKMGAGDPIPGVDVSLEQVPGGIIAHTQTGDGTGGTTNGVFTFENVPSSANPYRVLVDIPGSEQLEEHEVTVTTDNSTVTNLNYVLAEEGIIIAGPNSVREVKENITIGIYPNPFNNELTITYQTEGKELVKIELTDMLGKSTTLLNQNSSQKGTYIFKTNTEEMNLSNGVYFLKTTIGDNSNITRVVKM